MKSIVTRFFKVISIAYLCFPVLYLFLAAVFFDMSGKHLLSILLSPFFYFVSFWAVIVGYGFWEMRRWAWYLFTFTNVLVVYLSAHIVINYSDTHHKVLGFLTSVLIIGALTYRVSREIRVPYFLPRIRWWERNTAFQISIPVTLLDDEGNVFEGVILDFSLKGCFIKIKDHLPYDTRVSLGFKVFGQLIRVFGSVVWKTDSTVTLPKGVGIKFEPMGRRVRKKIRIAERRVQRVLKIYRNAKDHVLDLPFQQILESLEKNKVESKQLRLLKEKPLEKVKSAP